MKLYANTRLGLVSYAPMWCEKLNYNFHLSKPLIYGLKTGMKQSSGHFQRAQHPVDKEQSSFGGWPGSTYWDWSGAAADRRPPLHLPPYIDVHDEVKPSSTLKRKKLSNPSTWFFKRPSMRVMRPQDYTGKQTRKSVKNWDNYMKEKWIIFIKKN